MYFSFFKKIVLGEFGTSVLFCPIQLLLFGGWVDGKNRRRGWVGVRSLEPGKLIHGKWAEGGGGVRTRGGNSLSNRGGDYLEFRHALTQEWVSISSGGLSPAIKKDK